MANAREIAELLTRGVRGPEGPEDAAFHTGTVVSWDNVSGANTININGTIVSNVRTLSAGIGIRFNAGETVVLIRKQSQFFILGKVGSTGGTTGSGILSSQGTFITTFGTGGAWGNPPSGAGPSVNAYIGSSRSALVFFQCNIKCRVGDTGFASDVYDPLCLAAVSFEVTGASSIPADAWAGQTVLHQAEFYNAGAGRMVAVLTTVSGSMSLFSGHGLNSGLNTFTMKYKTGQTAEFQYPSLTVVPL